MYLVAVVCTFSSSVFAQGGGESEEVRMARTRAEESRAEATEAREMAIDAHVSALAAAVAANVAVDRKLRERRRPATAAEQQCLRSVRIRVTRHLTTHVQRRNAGDAKRTDGEVAIRFAPSAGGEDDKIAIYFNARLSFSEATASFEAAENFAGLAEREIGKLIECVCPAPVAVPPPGDGPPPSSGDPSGGGGLGIAV